MVSDTLSREEKENLIDTLKKRFNKNISRHQKVDWQKVQEKLESRPEKLWSLYEMERTGGEPDVIEYDEKADEYIFCDCSPESPKGRRSLCYDRESQEARKEHKPKNNVMDMAAEMGLEVLDEAQYHQLQKSGDFDNKTSSWLKTPEDIRRRGGAIFGDFRYGHVFIYHNSAESYYAARGFRGILRV